MKKSIPLEKITKSLSSQGKLVVLPIGLPGSGKSTFVQTIKSTIGYRVAIHSTDEHFMDKDGVYRFDPTMVNKYHERVLQDFKKSLIKRVPLVIVDNTNLKAQFRKKFVRMAERFGYLVEMVLIGEFTEEAAKRYAKRNVHGVPLDVILDMLKNANIPLNAM